MENSHTISEIAKAYYQCEFAESCTGCPYNNDNSETPTLCIDELKHDVLNILESSVSGNYSGSVDIYDDETDNDIIHFSSLEDDEFSYKLDDIADLLKGKKVS